MKVVYRSKLMRLAPPGIEAFAWDGVVHVRGDTVSPLVLAHEIAHLRQQERMGLLRFLAHYITDALFKKRNLLELQADEEVVAQYSRPASTSSIPLESKRGGLGGRREPLG